MLFIVYLPFIFRSSVTSFVFVLGVIDPMRMTGSFQGDYRFVRKAAGGKSETRSPKSEGNPKAEIRNPRGNGGSRTDGRRHGFFPLTPALSLGEREALTPPLEYT